MLLNFIIQWVIVVKLGTNNETDALFGGMVIPQLCLSILSTSLTYVLIPIFSVTNKKQKKEDLCTFLFAIFVVFLILSIILYSTSSYWVPLTVPGFAGENIILTIKLTRIQLIGMVFNAVLSVLWAYYNSENKFIWIEISSAIANTISVFLLFVFLSKYGVSFAAWIMNIKLTLMILLLLPFIGPLIRPNWKSTSLKITYHRIKSLVIGTTYYKSGYLIDRYLLSMDISGGISLYNLAQQIYSAGFSLIGKTINGPMVPKLSKYADQNKWFNFNKLNKRTSLIVLLFTILCFLIVVIIGRLLIPFFFGYGQINADNLNKLWLILLCLGGYWIGGALGQTLTSSFYSLGETKLPTKIGIFSFTIGIVLKIIGFRIGGILGLAIATSLYYVIYNTTLILSLNSLLSTKTKKTKSYNKG